MKKTILLLVTVISISTTFAQYNGNQQRGNGNHDVVVNSDSRDYGYSNSNKDYGYDRGTYFFSAKDKDMQIAQINRDYDKKIQSLKMRFFMGRFQKEKMISSLQVQRNTEISAVNAKFYDKKNMFNQQGKKYDDRDKNHKW